MPVILEKEVSIAAIGLTVFSLYQTWQGAAPTMAQLRAADRNDRPIRAQLLDAEMLIGSVTVLIAVGLAWYTKDKASLVLLVATFLILSLWSHAVLNSEKIAA